MWVIGQVKMFLLCNEKTDLTVSKEIALNSDELLSFVLFAELKFIQMRCAFELS